MKITLTYQTNYAPYCWVLDTSDGIGMQVDYQVKPTNKQVKNQVKAVRNYHKLTKPFGMSYSVSKGRML